MRPANVKTQYMREKQCLANTYNTTALILSILPIY